MSKLNLLLTQPVLRQILKMSRAFVALPSWREDISMGMKVERNNILYKLQLNYFTFAFTMELLYFCKFKKIICKHMDTLLRLHAS